MSEYRHSVDAELRVLAKKSEFLYDVEIWLLNDKVNRNKWKYINLEQNAKKFAGTPILIAYVNEGKTIGDGHNFTVERDPVTGEERADFRDKNAERIVGALSEDLSDIRLVQRDGYTWIVGRGYLWRWYAAALVDKIEDDARLGRNMSISIETLVTKSRMDGDVEIEEEYDILGTTILGDHVMPAVADARIIALREAQGAFDELKVRAASFVEKPHEKEMSTNMDTQTNSVDPVVEPAAEPVVDYTAEVERLNGEIERLTAEAETAGQTIRSLQSIVDVCRKASCAAAARRALNDFNTHRKEVVGEDKISAVMADIEAGVYTTNAYDKEWSGEARVEEAVLVICAREEMAFAETRKAREDGQHAWGAAPAKHEDDGVAGLLARKGIR